MNILKFKHFPKTEERGSKEQQNGRACQAADAQIPTSDVLPGCKT
jgi:hypothetical protein